MGIVPERALVFKNGCPYENGINPCYNRGRRTAEMAREKKFDPNKYADEWKKVHVKRYCLALNRNTDKDIIAHLETVPSKQGYIKGLIRQDMKRRG